MPGSGVVPPSRRGERRASSARPSVGFERPAPPGCSPCVCHSGFYNHKVVAACRARGVRFSITVRLSPALHRVIGGIADADWVPIPYWLDGAADVAETTYTPFATRGTGKAIRLTVRRVKPTPGSQLEFKGFQHTYHAFITDRDGETLELEADHRRNAVVENAYRHSAPRWQPPTR
jgi:hypothetical protein